MEGTGIEESHLNFTMKGFYSFNQFTAAILQKERHKCTSNRNKKGISYEEVDANILDPKAGNIPKENESSKLESCTNLASTFSWHQDLNNQKYCTH